MTNTYHSTNPYHFSFVYHNFDIGLRSQIFGNTPQKDALIRMVQRVFSPDSYLSQQDKGVMYVSVYDLSYELDISELQLRMSLSHLVQTNVISELTHVYGKFKCGVVVNEKAYQKVLSDWAQGLVDQGTTSMLNDMIRATTTTPPTTETMKRLANVLVTILRKEGGGGGDAKQASRWVNYSPPLILVISLFMSLNPMVLPIIWHPLLTHTTHIIYEPYSPNFTHP